MYRKGDIEADKWWGYDSRWGCEDDEQDAEGNELPHPYDGQKVISLPHSCDSWIIGGEKEARQLIADLEEAIKKLTPTTIRR